MNIKKFVTISLLIIISIFLLKNFLIIEPNEEIEVKFIDPQYEIITTSGTQVQDPMASYSFHTSANFFSGKHISTEEFDNRWLSSYNIFLMNDKLYVSGFENNYALNEDKVEVIEKASPFYSTVEPDVREKTIGENYVIIDYWTFFEFYDFTTEKMKVLEKPEFADVLMFDENKKQLQTFESIANALKYYYFDETDWNFTISNTIEPLKGEDSVLMFDEEYVYSREFSDYEDTMNIRKKDTLETVKEDKIPLHEYETMDFYYQVFEQVGDYYIYPTNNKELALCDFKKIECKTYDISPYITDTIEENERFGDSSVIAYTYNLEENTMYLAVEDTKGITKVYDLEKKLEILQYKNNDKNTKVTGVGARRKL